MTVDENRTVTIGRLMQLVRDLRSEDAENSEYDRALVELVTDAAGLPMNGGKEVVADLLGIKNQ